jgi:hypothetical protein
MLGEDDGGMNITAMSKGAASIAALADANTGTRWILSPARFGLTPPTMAVPMLAIFSVQKLPCLPVMPWTRTRWPLR